MDAFWGSPESRKKLLFALLNSLEEAVCRSIKAGSMLIPSSVPGLLRNAQLDVHCSQFPGADFSCCVTNLDAAPRGAAKD